MLKLRSLMGLGALALVAGCSTTHTFEGADEALVWHAAREVMLERDAHAMVDPVDRRQWSETREEPWYADVARWVSLGAFGTTGHQVQLALRETDAGVRLRICARYDLVALWFPVSIQRSSIEQEVLAAIQARVAEIEPAPGQGELRAIDVTPSSGGSARPGPEPPAPAPEGMVLIAGGDYTIGASDADEDARPPHQVKLQAFYLDVNEVTNAEYRRFLEWYRTSDRSCDHPQQPAGVDHVPSAWTGDEDEGLRGDDQPVVGVTWFDAYAYAKWAGKRLPTEAEWEAAARGRDGRAYPWGGEAVDGRANTREAEVRASKPVGSYPTGTTPSGVADLGGNVWEWCADWYDPKYYASSPAVDPTGPATGTERVIRGGGWNSPARMARATYRNFRRPVLSSNDLGFRCAKDAR